MDERCREFGLSSGEAHLLGYCSLYGPCPIGELHRVFGVQRSTLTSVLDRLEQRGWLSRSPNPHDRRSQLVSASKEGKKLAGKMRELHIAFEDDIVAAVSPAQLKAFQEVMAAIDQVTGVQVRRAE
jgi:DNA-binding MarR family transcriptional regulator